MFGILFATVLVAVFVHLAFKTWKNQRIFNRFEGPQGLVNVPHQVNPDASLHLLELEKACKEEVLRLHLLPWYSVLLIFGPELNAKVLKGNDPKAEVAYRTVKPWLGKGLLLASGKRWARNRRLLTPAFHFQILKPYMDTYNDAANILVNKWNARADGSSFNLMDDISLVTLDVILRCSMSQETNCQTEKTNPYVEAVLEVSLTSMDRLFRPWLWNDWLYWLTPGGRKFYRALRILHERSATVIRERQKYLAENADKLSGRKYRDFLDILLTAEDDQQKGLTFKEIRDEVDTFMFEGHDTTAHGIAWTLYLLGLHPEHQRRCQKEIDGVLDSEDRDFTWEDMNRLTYTHQCIKEAMRIYPPVPGIGRETTEDTEINGKFVPAGTSVFLHTHGLHLNPKHFENPLDFNPDRFSSEALKERNAYAYTPFSAGPRNCIGQVFAANEERVVISKILKKFDVETDRSHEIKLRIALVLRSTTGICIRLKPRSQ